MSQVTEIATDGWTATDLVERFGAIPLNHIRREPADGYCRVTISFSHFRRYAILSRVSRSAPGV
jgi:hypothetical protein